MGNKHRLQILYEMGLQRALLYTAQRHKWLYYFSTSSSSANREQWLLTPLEITHADAHRERERELDIPETIMHENGAP